MRVLSRKYNLEVTYWFRSQKCHYICRLKSAGTLSSLLKINLIPIFLQLHSLSYWFTGLLYMRDHHTSKCLEQFFYIFTCFWTYLNKSKFHFLTECCKLFHFNFFLFIKVRFRPDNNFFSTIFTVIRNMLQPVLKMMKRLYVCDIKSDNKSLCPSVVSFSNSVKSFLSGCIPDL